MRITGVQLKNIACFEDLSLDFTNENTGEPAPWTVILGANGCGKSTLLLMLSAAILGSRRLSVVAGRIYLGALVRLADDKAQCTFNAIPSAGTFGITISNMTLIDVQSGQLNDDLTKTELEMVTGTADDRFACGYGTGRIHVGSEDIGSESFPVFDTSTYPYRFSSLFGNSFGMTNVPNWMAGLYFATRHPDHTVGDENRYQRASDGVVKSLPHVSSLSVAKDGRVMVTEGDKTIPLERLSDGYRGTLAWIGDLIRRLFDAYPDSDDPLKESGVVLVDEIDLHLHPKWQRSVVEDVRKLFPNLQFIVTSHSPFVAQDMQPEDKIIVLERSGKDGKGPVVAREENGSLEDWSADQILTSFFGLENGTRGEETQKAEKRFVQLLGAEARGTLTSKQSKELEQLRAKIDAIPLGETPDERAFYKMADSVVAMLQRDTDELLASSNGVHEESQPYDADEDSASTGD